MMDERDFDATKRWFLRQLAESITMMTEAEFKAWQSCRQQEPVVGIICRRCERNRVGVTDIFGDMHTQPLYAAMGLCVQCGANDRSANYSVVKNMMQNLRLSQFEISNVESISRDYRKVVGFDGRVLYDGIEVTQ